MDDVPPCPETRDILWDGVRLQPVPPPGSMARACAGVVQKEIPSGFALCVTPSLRDGVCWEGYENRWLYVEDGGRERVLCSAPGGSPPAIPATYGCPSW